jgi:hypothetical protein
VTHLQLNLLLEILEFALLALATTINPDNPLLPFLVRVFFQLLEIWLHHPLR